MTRETKVGLVIASSFLCLVGIVVASKIRPSEPAPTGEETQDKFVLNKPSEGHKPDDKPKKESGPGTLPALHGQVKENDNSQAKKSEPTATPTGKPNLPPLNIGNTPIEDPTVKHLREQEELRKKNEKGSAPGNVPLPLPPVAQGSSPSNGTMDLSFPPLPTDVKSAPLAAGTPPPLQPAPMSQASESDPLKSGLPLPVKPPTTGVADAAPPLSAKLDVGPPAPTPLPYPQKTETSVQASGKKDIVPPSPANASVLLPMPKDIKNPAGSGPQTTLNVPPLSNETPYTFPPAPVAPVIPPATVSKDPLLPEPAGPRPGAGADFPGPGPAPFTPPAPIVKEATPAPAIIPAAPADLGANIKRPDPPQFGNPPAFKPSIPDGSPMPIPAIVAQPSPPVPEPRNNGPLPTIRNNEEHSLPPISLNPSNVTGIPPVASLPAAGRPASGVRTTDLETDQCRPGETDFLALSRRFYGSEKYATALQAYNRSHSGGLPNGAVLALPTPQLAPGQYVLKPPVGVLERDYRMAEPNPIAPAISSMPPVKLATPAPLSPPAVIPSPGIIAVQNPPTTDPTRSYTVQNPAGESVLDIAERVLGNRSRWNEVYRLNPNIRPEFPIPAGTPVRLPAS